MALARGPAPSSLSHTFLEWIALEALDALDRGDLAGEIIEVPDDEELEHYGQRHRPHAEPGQVDRPSERRVVGVGNEVRRLSVDRLRVLAAGRQIDAHGAVPLADVAFGHAGHRHRL